MTSNKSHILVLLVMSLFLCSPVFGAEDEKKYQDARMREEEEYRKNYQSENGSDDGDGYNDDYALDPNEIHLYNKFQLLAYFK